MLDKDLRKNELYEYRFGFKEQKSNNIFILLLLCALFAFMAFRTYFVSCYGGVNVHGESMNMTLQSGDKLLMRKTDGWRKAERGDVIVVYVGDYEECKGVGGGHLIKRLIAVGGEWVKCTDGVVQISKDEGKTWTPLDEPYAYYGEKDVNKDNYDFGVYKVAKDEIFFLGDNRSRDGSSIDSRFQDSYVDGQGKKVKLSHLDCLYKEDDIVGIVFEWAIDYREFLADLPIWAKEE
jgi:signal peptidase I